MKNTLIKTGAAVPSLKVGNVSYNTEQIIAIMQDHKDCGLLVFPELCLTGYTCADLFGQSLLLDEAQKALLKIAEADADMEGLTVVVGLPLRVSNQLYNCAAFISDGAVAGIVPKQNIPTYSEFYESRWFVSGRNTHNHTVKIGEDLVPFGDDLIFEDIDSNAIVGTDICEDLWVPDKPSTHYCLAGANIIVNLSASDELIGKEDYRREIVKAQSAACYCAYVYVSSGTDESSTDLVFSGHSMIAENGTLMKDSLFTKRPHVETALIDLEKIAYNRAHQNTFAEENDREYRRIPVHISPVHQKEIISSEELLKVYNEENYSVDKNPFVPPSDAERKTRCKKILAIQANGLATRVRNTGIHNLVIGISGGLDSTLALLVCHEAKKIEPAIHIIAYTLPNHGNTTSLTYTNAVHLMDALQVEKREVAIEEGVKLHLNELGHGNVYKGEGDTTYENAQARYRTYILMDAANMENGLVVGTGDLSELALGWCTYNGDHMSMYGVNASVPKTLVRYICEVYADTMADQNLHDILHSIIDTPISPELTPSKNGQIAQKTEEKIGKYDLNDFFLFYVLRYGMEPGKILALAQRAYPEVSDEAMRTALIRFYQRFFHQQFKRSCLPDGPKVGSVTLSPRGDWRMPSDADVKMWIESIKNA